GKDRHAVLFAAVSVASDPPNREPSGNHKGAKKGIPNRKETTAKISFLANPNMQIQRKRHSYQGRSGSSRGTN
ncbi:MAG TPA: hypothetical protein QF630_12710, partial [Alphaproteobacteria bacterium]|nr:hypothetical protein [Alphaproteobacteria bacterium]